MQCLPLETCDTTETMNTEAKERGRSPKEGGREGERERVRERKEKERERREREREGGKARERRKIQYRDHNKSFLNTTETLMALELIAVVINVYQTLLSSLKK